MAIDFPTDFTDTEPTLLVGVKGGTPNVPSKATLGATGRASMAAANAGKGRLALDFNELADWDDWRWSGPARNTGPTVPPFVDLNSSGVFCWQFEDGDELHFSDLQLPHDYKEGTDLIPHIHWCPTTTETYTGTWTLEFIDWLTIDTGTPVQSKSTVTAAFNAAMTAFQMQSVNFSDIMLGVVSTVTRRISSIVHAKLSLALSAGASCALLGLDAHYQKDKLGSAQATEKNPA